MESLQASRKITLFRHQAQFYSAPWNPQAAGVDYHFHIAGYGAGKSYGDCALILNLVRRYHNHEVTIGIGGTSLMFLKKTLLLDLFRIFNFYGIPYDFDKQSGVIKVNRMQFMCIGVENPDTIYGYNYHAFIDDELDELPQLKAVEAAKAIMERTRLVFPDGRQPFQAYSSTAQGYKGLYQVVMDLKDKGEPTVLIRGETRFNTLLSRKVIERWSRLYNENERMAFLEGRFVNLTTGRVYAEYDESKCRTGVKPFPIGVQDIVHVGQDLNLGYSFGTAIVKRAGVLYVTRVWSFPVIGRAPGIMRAAYPQSEIRWYPDASGNEIIAGYAAEVRQAGIKTRIGTINPSVLDRIFVVNKLLATGRMKIFDVPETAPISMALKVRQYNESGDPEKGKGPNAPDHAADSLEYPTWRIVSADPEFADIWSSTRAGRAEAKRIA